MRFLFGILLALSTLSPAFAGEMKKIDVVTRQTVADTYYTGFDYDEGYYDFMYAEIWSMKLEESKSEDCLVVTTGMTTETVLDTRKEVPFKVCINKLEDGSYTGYLF